MTLIVLIISFKVGYNIYTWLDPSGGTESGVELPGIATSLFLTVFIGTPLYNQVRR